MPSPFARHFSILFFCVLAGLFLAAVITWQMPKRFTSTATVQIRGSAPLDPAVQKENIGRSDILQAVMENLGLEEKWNTDAAETLRRLRGGLEVRGIRHTELLQIRIRDADPVLAAEIANTLATEFQRHALALQQEAIAQGLKQLQDEIADKKQEVTELHARLKTLRIEGGIMDLDPEQSSENRPSLEEALAKQKEKVAALRALQERSPARTPGEFLAAWKTSGLADVPFEKILAGVSQTSAEETRLRDSGVGPNHPSIKSLRAKREVMEGQLRELASVLKSTVPAELQTAEERLRILEAIAASGSLPEPSAEILAQYEATKNRYLLSKTLVAAAEKKLGEERVVHGLPQQPVLIWEKAEPPEHPQSPRPDLNLLLGGVLGGLAGLLLVLVSGNRQHLSGSPG